MNNELWIMEFVGAKNLLPLLIEQDGSRQSHWTNRKKNGKTQQMLLGFSLCVLIQAWTGTAERYLKNNFVRKLFLKKSCFPNYAPKFWGAILLYKIFLIVSKEVFHSCLWLSSWA